MDSSLSVSDITFVAFDFETTGLHPATDRIIELGAVKFQDRAVLGTFDMLVNPGVAITDAAVNVSGITAEMLASKPAVDQALPEFMEFISGAVLVAHNAPFDMSFLRAALELAGMGERPQHGHRYPGARTEGLSAASKLQFAEPRNRTRPHPGKRPPRTRRRGDVQGPLPHLCRGAELHGRDNPGRSPDLRPEACRGRRLLRPPPRLHPPPRSQRFR